jgi:GxxExxY protein
MCGMEKLCIKNCHIHCRGHFFEVYKELGCSFKEKAYENALIHEYSQRSLKADSQKRINIKYKGINVGTYVPDLIVDDKIIVELKCKSMLTQQDIQQFWNYLKGSNYKVGYLVNFGQPGKVEYIRRVYDEARQK